jgi:hypothetical protein
MLVHTLSFVQAANGHSFGSKFTFTHIIQNIYAFLDFYYELEVTLSIGIKRLIISLVVPHESWHIVLEEVR